MQLTIYKSEHCDFGGSLSTVGVVAFCRNMFCIANMIIPRNGTLMSMILARRDTFGHVEATIFQLRNSHSTCEQSSPCRVILGSCTVPALRSVWYKNTTSCSLWTLAKHTGSHACSMLETRGVSQQDVCFYA